MKKEEEKHENIKVDKGVMSIEEFYKIATREQKELLSQLYDAAQKEMEIARKINSIYESISFCTYLTDQSVTICESNDDADVISLGQKIELSKVRSQIGALLKKAVDELSMGNVGMIRRQYDNYVK